MKTVSIARPFVLAALAASAACAFAAANLPKEGSYDVTACWTGTANDLVFNKDHTANSYEMLGTIMSNPPGGFADGSTFRCVGMNTAIKGKMGGGNVCQVTDPDGDKRLNAFHIEADGKVVRENLGGTGKYEGMTQTNTVAMLPPMKEAKPGTFQGCNRQTGTYKLK
jgi:hypothetical protein